MNGVFYLLKYTWKFQKKYIVLSFIHELCLAAVPFANIILPQVHHYQVGSLCLNGRETAGIVF